MAEAKTYRSDILPEEAREVLTSAYKHACEALPGLDEESFVNGFLYGLRFGGTAETLRIFMGEAY